VDCSQVNRLGIYAQILINELKGEVDFVLLSTYFYFTGLFCTYLSGLLMLLYYLD
jgi:hypothetical protein